MFAFLYSVRLLKLTGDSSHQRPRGSSFEAGPLFEVLPRMNTHPLGAENS